MAQYMFSFYVKEAWTAAFEADSEEHALELLKQVQADEISLSDLPDYVEENHGVETEIDLDSLEDYR